jgi:hypothetical protein
MSRHGFRDGPRLLIGNLAVGNPPNDSACVSRRPSETPTSTVRLEPLPRRQSLGPLVRKRPRSIRE